MQSCTSIPAAGCCCLSRGRSPTPAYIRYRCAIQRLDEYIYALFDSRRSQPTSLFDLLNLLLEARDDQGEGMWGQQLRDEVITLILAGHETTSLVLSWTLNLLSRKPEVEAKLLAEIGQVTGGNPPSVDKLPLLPYTAAVIKEVLRLYPPAYAVPRQALEDVAIGGYLVPLGSSVVFSLGVIRRDERFFPEPHSFYPERWLDKGKGRSEVAKHSFYPFGGGQRRVFRPPLPRWKQVWDWLPCCSGLSSGWNPRCPFSRCPASLCDRRAAYPCGWYAAPQIIRRENYAVAIRRKYRAA